MKKRIILYLSIFFCDLILAIILNDPVLAGIIVLGILPLATSSSVFVDKSPELDYWMKTATLKPLLPLQKDNIK